MSLLYPVPPAVLARHFVYRGWFCGIVPVYVGRLNEPGGPPVTCRNGVPEWLLDFAHVAWDAAVFLATMANPAYVSSGWPIKVTGRLDGLPITDGELP